MPRRRINVAVVLILSVILIVCLVFDVYSVSVISSNDSGPILEALHIRKNETFLIEENIKQHFLKLAPVYRNKNPEFFPILFELRNRLNSSACKDEPLEKVWDISKKWPNRESIFPAAGKGLAQVITALKSSRITKAENAKKGTQLKLLLTLDGNQTVIFKPKWYDKNHVINDLIYGGFDRHNSEVVGFILALLLDIRLAPVSVIRQIHLKKDVWLLGTAALKKTMVLRNNKTCVYGECLYCNPKITACADEKSGHLEGAVILVVPGAFSFHKSPWMRTYKKDPAKWQNDAKYCKKVETMLPVSRILDFVDAAVFDFLLQNGDRHHYDIFNQRVLLMDNGKGLGNPHVDVMDILAPLYQCCILRNSTWERLLLLSGNTLSYSVKTLEKFFIPESNSEITTNLQLNALDRRILKVYATVLYCLETKGPSHVFRS